jgi:hypothetical protein
MTLAGDCVDDGGGYPVPPDVADVLAIWGVIDSTPRIAEGGWPTRDSAAPEDDE